MREIRAPCPCDRNHRACGDVRPAFECEPDQRKAAVELDFDRERPKHAVDRAVAVGEPRMDEEQVRQDRRTVCDGLRLRVPERERDADRQRVRRKDLDETAPRKVRPSGLRPAGCGGAHERIDDDESAQKEEEMNADEAGFRHELQPRQRRRQPRDFPDVVPQDEQHGDAAQPVQNIEPALLMKRPASSHRPAY